jgi:signal transduction histidine kinase
MPLSPEQAGDLRRQVRLEIARLRTLSDELSLFARPGLRPASVDLHAMIAAVLDGLQPRFAQQSVEARLDLHERGAPLAVLCDAAALEHALAHLFSNALEASAERTSSPLRLVVRTGRLDHLVTLEIEDNGPGFDAGIRDRLFEPFVTTKRARPGRPGCVTAGLGLAISRRLMVLQGGTLTAREAPGGGALLHLELPESPTGVGPA